MITRSVLIIGLGASGMAAARYCGARPDRFGPVVAFDSRDTDGLREHAAELQRLGVRVELGITEVYGRYDFCVASPGIPPHSELYRSAFRASGELISEIEFAYRESEIVWAAVTGTNGKTTTTALLTHLLDSSGMPARAVGNIGAPAIEAVDRPSGSTVFVAEVSSFQLAGTRQFHPRVALLLNITPDHIDWHGSEAAYSADKMRIFDNMDGSDTAVVDIDDPGAAAAVPRLMRAGVRVARVSRTRLPEDGAGLVDGVLTLSSRHGDIALLPAEELLIRGPHNESNALAAAAAAHALGVRTDALIEGLRTFKPIEHRLEPVTVLAGAEWFNDSKATNPDAVSKAIASFGDRPLVLLLGGRNKGSEFHELARQARDNVRQAVVFGESKDQLSQAFENAGVPVVVADGMREAVRRAAGVAMAGDAVVLSPACASFDEFDDYEQRGRVFKDLVRELAAAEGEA